jgi:hypothetical protein
MARDVSKCKNDKIKKYLVLDKYQKKFFIYGHNGNINYRIAGHFVDTTKEMFITGSRALKCIPPQIHSSE